MHIGELTLSILTDVFVQTVKYLPQLISGLIIVFIGLIVGGVLQGIIRKLFTLKEIHDLLEKARISKKRDTQIWSRIISEIVRWTIVILFLVPAAEVWGIPRVTEVFTQLLFFIPNVLVAVFVGLVGVVLANIVSDVVKHAVESLGAKSRGLLSTGARYAILFFTALVVLNQLGIASDLIRILFTGIVAMLAIAGGLAFGLGGQRIAEEVLRELKQRISH